MKYMIAKPSEYLIVTGSGITDIKLAKKGWIWPMQSARTFDISPMNYSFDVQAMSIEKLPFTLPAVFTIGPRDDVDSLKRYAKLIAAHDMSGSHVTDLIKGIVEGETRVLAAGMSMEEVFKGTKAFKQEVFNKVQLELDQFGLHIYNANIKQLVDIKGHEYFSYLGQKTQQEAANQAKVDVAEAKYKGDTGAKEREGLTLRNKAKVEAETKIYTKNRASEARQQEVKVDAETKIFENLREAEVAEANATLAAQKAQWEQTTKIAQIEADRTASIRDAELTRDLEKKKALAETERLRGQALARATVDYEVNVQATNAQAYKVQKEADAIFYTRSTEAEGVQKEADAFLYRQQKQADALLYAKEKEAEGIRIMAQAQAAYVTSMLSAFEGNVGAFHDFLMIDRKVYQEMGQINANAIKGLEPKVSVWTTGNSSADGSAPSAAQPIADVYRMIPPLFSTIKEQTGINGLPNQGMPTLHFMPQNGNSAVAARK
ncbi:flotillin [Marchantia polymorpha subsp. ruderalis]